MSLSCSLRLLVRNKSNVNVRMTSYFRKLHHSFGCLCGSYSFADQSQHSTIVNGRHGMRRAKERSEWTMWRASLRSRLNPNASDWHEHGSYHLTLSKIECFMVSVHSYADSLKNRAVFLSGTKYAPSEQAPKSPTDSANPVVSKTQRRTGYFLNSGVNNAICAGSKASAR